MTVETEVVAKARRRRFTAAEKLRVLKEAAGCTKLGALGVLLRREGLYSSHLATWRVARQRGELAGLTPRAHGPKAKPVDPRDRQLAEQTREIARLQSRLDVFSKPIRIDGGDPIGRVGTTLMRDGSALVSWLETESGKTTIKVRQVTASGRLGSPKIVAASSSVRASGFPQVVRTGDDVWFAWTAPGAQPQIKLASAAFQTFAR